MYQKPPLRVLFAGPRGCAGMDRAIQVVEEARRRYGTPVYVRHEIVHNRTVVEQLEALGAVFVEELDEVPADAQRRHLFYLDATCPLMSKVYREAERHFAGGGPETQHILMIGHAGHLEVIGTMGQLLLGPSPSSRAQKKRAVCGRPVPEGLAFITQTTLSVEKTAEIVTILCERFPSIEGLQAREHLLRQCQPSGRGEGRFRELRPAGSHQRPELT